jgi:arylsulfatase A-like enzyme
MNRRDFLKCVGAGAALGVSAGCMKTGTQTSAAKPKWFDRLTTLSRVEGKPNVLFILTDDQREDTIGALGNPHIKTPNLDKLVRSGLTFTNAYCMGGNAGAVCRPSRNMLLSGRAYFRFGTNGADGNQKLYAGPDMPNFPDSMNQAGYETYHHGKQGNTERLLHPRFNHTKYVVHHQTFDTVQPGKIICDDAITFLKTRSKAKPFFMYLAFSEPHDPRNPAPEFLAQYQREATQGPKGDIPLPQNYLPFHPFDNGELKIRDEQLEAWPRTKDAIRRHIHEYYGMITGLDHHIGRLIQAIKDLGEHDNTIIIFSSDQGIAIGSHGLMGKQNLYEHSMGVPLFLTGPGIPKGKTSDAFVYLLDVFPTVCELVGEQVPPGLDGKSLAPVIRGQRDGVRDTIFLAYRNFQRAVRRGRWKLLRYPLINKTQLFDLQNDPYETKDLANNPANARKVKELMALMAEQQKLFGDTDPLTSENPGPAEIGLEFFKNPPPKKNTKKQP